MQQKKKAKKKTFNLADDFPKFVYIFDDLSFLSY